MGAVRTRAVVADDDVLLREGLTSVLERSGFEVIGQCGDGQALTALVRKYRPELALIDIRMPPTHTTEGLDAARMIRGEFRVTDGEDFIQTIERIVNGGSIVDPALVRELVDARRVEDPLDGVTPREREVLALMAEGRSNAGIAKALWVTEGTVEKHVH